MGLLPLLSHCVVFAVRVPLRRQLPESCPEPDRPQGVGGPGCALYGLFSRESDRTPTTPPGTRSPLQLEKALIL